MTSELEDPTEAAPTVAPAKSRRRGLIEWLIVLVAVVVLSLLVRTFVVQDFSIPSGSMRPTLGVGNRILVDKLSVDFGTINVGDIVVFKAPPAVATLCHDNIPDLVKRVIGVPGDVLNTVGNTIFIDGHKLHQRWPHFPALGTGPESAIHDFTVPAGQYFMMGDNHAISCDSRTWGTVPRSDIIGKVFLKFWPLSQWHWF